MPKGIIQSTDKKTESPSNKSTIQGARKSQINELCDTFVSSETYNTMKEFLNIIRTYWFTRDAFDSQRSYDFDQKRIQNIINRLPKQWCDTQMFKNKLCENFRKSYMGRNSDWGNIVARFRNILSAEAYDNPHQFTEKYGIAPKDIPHNLLDFQDKLTNDILYQLIEHDIKWFDNENRRKNWSLYHLSLYYTELLKDSYSECINSK